MSNIDWHNRAMPLVVDWRILNLDHASWRWSALDSQRDVIFPNGLRSQSIGTHSMANCHTMSIRSMYLATAYPNDKWYSLECHETLLNYLKHFSNFLPLSSRFSQERWYNSYYEREANTALGIESSLWANQQADTKWNTNGCRADNWMVSLTWKNYVVQCPFNSDSCVMLERYYLYLSGQFNTHETSRETLLSEKIFLENECPLIPTIRWKKSCL